MIGGGGVDLEQRFDNVWSKLCVGWNTFTPAGILCRILGVCRHLLNSDTLQMLASFARGDRQRRDVGGLREGLPWPCCIDPPPPPYGPHWLNSQMGGAEHLALLIVHTAHLFTSTTLEKGISYATSATITSHKLLI